MEQQHRVDSKSPSDAMPQMKNTSTPPFKNPMPDFGDAKEAYAKKSMTELARAILSLHLCQFQWIVRNARPLHSFSRRFLGDWITDTALELTLFGHFCGGTDEIKMKPKIANLEEAGIGSILDFAAEDDGEESSNKSAADRIIDENVPKVRVYEYETEQKCDRHVDTFKRCIRAVKTMEKDGFAAVKVSLHENARPWL